MTLTLRSAADAAARATKSKSEARSARITSPPFHAKGVKVDGLRRSPGFASEDAQGAVGNGLEHPEFAGGLPGIRPSDRLRFSRLQLRGSAGVAPASLSLPRGKDAQ